MTSYSSFLLRPNFMSERILLMCLLAYWLLFFILWASKDACYVIFCLLSQVWKRILTKNNGSICALLPWCFVERWQKTQKILDETNVVSNSYQTNPAKLYPMRSKIKAERRKQRITAVSVLTSYMTRQSQWIGMSLSHPRMRVSVTKQKARTWCKPKKPRDQRKHIQIRD